MMDFSFIPPYVNRTQVDANFTAATPLSTPEKQHLCLASAMQERPKPEMCFREARYSISSIKHMNPLFIQMTYPWKSVENFTLTTGLRNTSIFTLKLK